MVAGLGVVAVGTLAVALTLSDHLPFVVVHNGLFTPLFALIIFAAATAPPSRLRSLLEHRALVTLGEASYALYILQSPLLGFLHGGLRRLLPEEATHRVVLATAGLGLTLLASVLAWRFVERPAREWLIKRWA